MFAALTPTRPLSPTRRRTHIPVKPDAVTGPDGLTDDEAQRRLASVGPNSMPDTAEHPLVQAAKKFWAPVPWMLEAAIILELALRDFTEAAVIAGLLVFNSALGYFQEGKAQATLTALKSRLALTASVRRNGAWKVVPSAEVVPGDVLKLALGAVVPGRRERHRRVGTRRPVHAHRRVRTRRGWRGFAHVRGRTRASRRSNGPGERDGRTTKFGNTAELVLAAHVVSSQQKVVLRIVRNLALFNCVVIVVLVGYANARGLAWSAIIPLVLTAVLASIPVALPATFTLATALGARGTREARRLADATLLGR